MLKLFESRGFANCVAANTPFETDQGGTPPELIQIDEAKPFPLVAHITRANGFPYVDWKAFESWIAALPQEGQAQAWFSFVRGWLLHLRAALGQQYRGHLRILQEGGRKARMTPCIAAFLRARSGNPHQLDFVKQ